MYIQCSYCENDSRRYQARKSWKRKINTYANVRTFSPNIKMYCLTFINDNFIQFISKWPHLYLWA